MGCWGLSQTHCTTLAYTTTEVLKHHAKRTTTAAKMASYHPQTPARFVSWGDGTGPFLRRWQASSYPLSLDLASELAGQCFKGVHVWRPRAAAA